LQSIRSVEQLTAERGTHVAAHRVTRWWCRRRDRCSGPL